MELKDTVDMMLSTDYKERFKAEYYQLAIRCRELRDMLARWDAGELDFTPAYPRESYNAQVHAMYKYLYVMEHRAKYEGIDL